MQGRRWIPVGLVLVVALGACSSGSSAASAAPVRARYAVPASTSSADAEQVARRMEDRFRALGVADVDVTVQGDTVVVRGDAEATTLAPIVVPQGELAFRPVLAIIPTGLGEFARAEPGPGQDLLPSAARSGTPSEKYVVGPAAVSNGVASASPEYLPGGMGWTVQMRFVPSAQREFDALGARSVGKNPPENAVAIVLDDVVQSAPAFQSTSFPDGVQITGNFTKRRAEALAATVATGPYPVPVRLLGDR